MLKRMGMTAIFTLIVCETTWAQESRAPQLYELTSRGVMSAAATEAYKQALDSCVDGVAGNAPQGPKFLACVKQQFRSESENSCRRVSWHDFLPQIVFRSDGKTSKCAKRLGEIPGRELRVCAVGGTGERGR